MAHFEKRGSKWRAQVSWYDLQGKRKFKTKQGFLTKRQAQEWANKMEIAKDNNQISNRDPVFAESFKDWANTYKKPGRTLNTRRRYDFLYKLLLKNFGRKKLSRITRRDYQRFMTKYGETHSKNSVEKANSTLRTYAKDAMSDGLIHVNFTSRINVTWNNEKTRKIDYLNANELHRLKESLLDGITPKNTSRYMLLTIMYTGMRPGEIAVLTWKDIDFKNQTISVNKSLNHDLKITDYVHQDINKATKNTNSVRVIKVNKELLDILSQLKKNHHERIFINKFGTIPSSNAVNHTLRAHLKKLGIHKKGFHFHSLRHSHVAYLLFKGVPLYAISKRLGHSSMTVTANIYAYFLEELKQKSNQQIIDVLKKL